MNTKVYVNGKRVTKEEIAKIEIQNEAVTRILAQHLSDSPDDSQNDNIAQSENKTL